MDQIPDKSLEECCRKAEDLLEQMKKVSFELLEAGDGELAELLTLMFISSQNNTMILVHRLNQLEKKVNALLAKGNKFPKRFDI